MVGLENVSSLDTWRADSRKAGDGDRVGFGASDSERGLGEFTPVRMVKDEDDVGVRSPSSSRCGALLGLPTGEATSSAILAVGVAMRWEMWFRLSRE